MYCKQAAERQTFDNIGTKRDTHLLAVSDSVCYRKDAIADCGCAKMVQNNMRWHREDRAIIS